jgi:Holliday junction resolvase RusA-like endonuclease
MTRSGIAYRLKPLAPLTGATASGSSRIPTPTAGDAKSTANATDLNPGGVEHLSGRHSGTTLTDFTRLWPTPTKQDSANDGGGAQGDRHSLPLNAAAKLWPTPKSTVSGPDYARAGRRRSGGDDLATAVAREPQLWSTPSEPAEPQPTPREGLEQAAAQSSGSLNPTWVEWLMGFPLGWTVCERWETRSSRRSRSGSASRSSSTKKEADVVVAEARRLSFRVVGKPEPRGSKNAFRTKTGATVVTDANPHSGPWMGVVADAALNAMIGEDGVVAPVMEGPLGLTVIFTVARPKGHYGTGRNAGVLKPSAPAYPAVKPDTTKLLRGLEDALSGVVWRDDAQVVEQAVAKRYGHPEGAQVIVWTL